MRRSLQKQAPIRLEHPEYEELRQRVLRRDGWRCQFCGCRLSLEVHHQQFRSQSGEDTEENLITLCANCHSVAHGTVRAKRLNLLWIRSFRSALVS
jgi:5-methylcytosine-specific restriction endonuclease McrA